MDVPYDTINFIFNKFRSFTNSNVKTIPSVFIILPTVNTIQF